MSPPVLVVLEESHDSLERIEGQLAQRYARVLRTSRISSVSKPHIEMLLRQMAVMRCANRRKLTDSNLSLKMRL